MSISRFIDSGEMLADFGDQVIAACPRCKKPVDYRIDLSGSGEVYPLTCLKCGYIRSGYKKDYKQNPLGFFTPTYDLYLVADCCGQTLWARNLNHLEFLEKYVSAKLRERTANINQSTASRLPQWIKSAKNRYEILKCIQRIRVRYEHEK